MDAHTDEAGYPDKAANCIHAAQDNKKEPQARVPWIYDTLLHDSINGVPEVCVSVWAGGWAQKSLKDSIVIVHMSGIMG